MTTADDLDKRAELTIWPGARTAQVRHGQEFATLREALCAAVDCEKLTPVGGIHGADVSRLCPPAIASASC
jgi:hypothetical protein